MAQVSLLAGTTMSEFEVLVIPLSLILGLGVTRVLAGFIHSIRSRETAAVHWLPILWGISILAYDIGYFNVLYDMDQNQPAWTWRIYGPVLFETILMFLSSGLIFPPEGGSASSDMREDFNRHGRLALIPLGVLLGTASVFNVLLGNDNRWLTPSNINNLVLTAIILYVLLGKSPADRRASAIVFLGLTIVGWLLFWSQPGTAA